MIFAVYAGESEESIRSNLGKPDYSYYFVLKSYLPVLSKIGPVFIVDSIAKEGLLLEQLYQDCRRCDEQFMFLSFTPPHMTGLNLKLPSLTVFAWEYSTIPDEAWGGDIQHDWRYALGRQGLAITHSNYAVTAVREAMGKDFPIVSVPAPIWDNFSDQYQVDSVAVNNTSVCLRYHGCLLDTDSLDFNGVTMINRDQALAGYVAQHITAGDQQVAVGGVVYTAVMNPIDGRKNWTDLLWAYCWAFREHDDVTLLIKVTHFDVERVWAQFINEFYKLQPFTCRIVLIHGFLDEAVYGELVKATSYVVNAAHGEGQCLPLMEFMSAGKPAIAPVHTAMADYINSGNSFIVDSSPEWIHWPHDPRLNFRAFRYRINWESLYGAYLTSYDVAKNSPQAYKAMSASAHRDLREHCSRAIAEKRLKDFLEVRAVPAQENRRRWWQKLFRPFSDREKALRKYASRLRIYSAKTDAA